MQQGSLAAVYFNRLTRDAEKPKARPELLTTYNIANANYVELSAEHHGFGGAAHILAMAEAEAEKEQEMLRQIFGVNLNIDLSQPGAIKLLTETINDVFEFRSIYERNKAMIMSDNFKGAKGIYSHFPTYFEHAFNKAKPGILNYISNAMTTNISLEASAAAKQAFDQFLPSIIQGALREMFTKANVEMSTTVSQEHRNAYMEMFHFITKFKSQNMFTQGLTQAWGLDKASEEFAKQFSNSKKIPKTGVIEKGATAAFNSISNNYHQKGGYSLEVLIDQALAMTVQGINSCPNISATAGMVKGAGKFEARADNVFYFNVNGTVVDNAMEQVRQDDSRENVVNIFSNLGTQLDKVKDGFIVYVNDKNYTLNDNFMRRGGMSAGASWSLRQVQGLLGGIVGNIDQVVYNILQNGKGAIKEGDTSNTSQVLAEGIAYYLFDDYTTIGNPGGNAIHVMGLQGMLIPLSAFLYALGSALNSIEVAPSAYVKVNISPNAVNDSNEASYFMPNWIRQYNESMDNTKISIHFMENFIGFVRGYL